MKERPIIFSAPMVRAILDGRKTQTRRAVKPRGGGVLGVRDDATVREVRSGEWSFGVDGPRGWSSLASPFACPYGEPGDRLWVREAWGLHRHGDETDWLKTSLRVANLDGFSKAYRADWQVEDGSQFWRPSIHMPRWASRITLEVTGVRVERLHDITEEDAKAEGAASRIAPGGDLAGAFEAVGDEDATISYRAHFRDLWQSINGADSWAANPWVWVVEFKRVTT